MTTATTSSAEFDAATICELACRRAGFEVEEITAGLAILSRQLLVGILNSWSNMSLVPWAMEKRTLLMTSGVESYSISSDVIELLTGATVSLDGEYTNTSSISREDFSGILNKDKHDRPSSYWFWKRSNPTVFFHPIPDASYAFEYWCVRRLKDVTAATQTLDIPMRWVSAIVDQLAFEVFDMMPAEKRMKLMNMRAGLEKRAALAKQSIRTSDVEQGSWFIFG